VFLPLSRNDQPRKDTFFLVVLARVTCSLPSSLSLGLGISDMIRTAPALGLAPPDLDRLRHSPKGAICFLAAHNPFWADLAPACVAASCGSLL